MIRTAKLAPVLVLLLGGVACWGGGETTPEPTVTVPNPDVEPSARRVEMTITADGYTPSSIQAEPGEKLSLVIRRMGDGNCGGELVFPATGAKHEIPEGEEVTIPVTAPASGELAFTCGMGMYEGAVVVGG